MILKLPWPLTINHYYGRRGNRTFLKQGAIQYRIEVLMICHQAKVETIEGPVKATWNIYPPDNRIRDYDNLFKGVQDSLTHAGVWLDDKQVKQSHYYERMVAKPGYVLATIEEMTEGEYYEQRYQVEPVASG